MKRNEVLRSLDHIIDMDDNDNDRIIINYPMIRQTALAAYSLIKQEPDRYANIACLKRIGRVRADLMKNLKSGDTLTRDLVLEILKDCAGKKARE